MELRFCAYDDKLRVRHKVLGARRHFGAGALAIAEAAKEIARRVCARNWGAPPRSVGNNTEEMLDSSMLEHIRWRVHMVSVDSAGDEVKSARDMCNPSVGSPVRAKRGGISA